MQPLAIIRRNARFLVVFIALFDNDHILRKKFEKAYLQVFSIKFTQSVAEYKSRYPIFIVLCLLTLANFGTKKELVTLSEKPMFLNFYKNSLVIK